MQVSDIFLLRNFLNLNLQMKVSIFENCEKYNVTDAKLKNQTSFLKSCNSSIEMQNKTKQGFKKQNNSKKNNKNFNPSTKLYESNLTIKDLAELPLDQLENQVETLKVELNDLNSEHTQLQDSIEMNSLEFAQREADLIYSIQALQGKQK